MRQIGPLEIFLLEVVLYLGLWVVYDYLAFILSIIAAGVLFAALLFALAAEVVERSKVPRQFFVLMLLSIVAPLLAAAIFFLAYGLPPWMVGQY